MITIMFTEEEVRTLVEALEAEEKNLRRDKDDDDVKDYYEIVVHLRQLLAAEVTL